MAVVPTVCKRFYAAGTLSLVLALFNRRRYRLFTLLGLAAFGAAWLWQRQRRLHPPLTLLEAAGLPAEGAVVDIGARDPRWLIRLEALVAPRPLQAVSGIVPMGPGQWLDRMETSLRRARLQERVTPVVADAGHLPLPDDRAALVILHDLTERLPDRDARRKAIAEAVRILAPGGKLIVSDSPWAKDAAAAMAEQGLGVRTVDDAGSTWLTATKGWT